MSEVLANVLKTVPDWQRLPADTPEPIRRLLRRALRKDPKLRARDMRDARLEIDDARNAASEPERAGSSGPARRERLAWASALLLLAAIAGFFGIRAFRPSPEAPELRLDLNTPPSRGASLALSPDGRQHRVRRERRRTVTPLAAVAGFIGDAPTGRHRARVEPFLVPGWPIDRVLRRQQAETRGDRRRIASAAGAGWLCRSEDAWNRDGIILFGNNPGGPLLRMSATGGDPVPATRIATAQQRGHAFPKFLPDERHFLFYSIGGPEAAGCLYRPARRSEGHAIVRVRRTGRLHVDRPPRCSCATESCGRKVSIQDSRQLSADPFVVAEGVSARDRISASQHRIDRLSDTSGRQRSATTRLGGSIGPGNGQGGVCRTPRHSGRRCPRIAGGSPCIASRTATWTSGYTKWGAAPGTGSRSIRETTSIRCGLPMAPASCSARCARALGLWISTGDVLGAAHGAEELLLATPQAKVSDRLVERRAIHSL